jgi:choline dehydrogenase
VILIEAGGRDWNPLIHIPVGYMKLLDHKQLNASLSRDLRKISGYWCRQRAGSGVSANMASRSAALTGRI